MSSFLKAQVSVSRAGRWDNGARRGHFLTFDPGRLWQNDKPGPPVLRRHSSSDIAKQKFGTMPLVPIRGDDSNHGMLSANQTLVKERRLRRVSLRGR